MIIVLNEWIFHDLQGDNGEAKLKEAAEFLLLFKKSGDKLVIPGEEQWQKKLFQLRRIENPVGREASKVFHSLMYESGKLIWKITGEGGTTGPSIPDGTPEEDIYLVEACLSADADVLVTTDSKLFEVLTEQSGYKCQMRGDFLSEYGVRLPNQATPG